MMLLSPLTPPSFSLLTGEPQVVDASYGDGTDSVPTSGRSSPRGSAGRRKATGDQQAWDPSSGMIITGLLLQGAAWAERWLTELPMADAATAGALTGAHGVVSISWHWADALRVG